MELLRYEDIDLSQTVKRSEEDVNNVLDTVSDILKNVRQNKDQALKDYTQKWLEKNNIPYDKLVMNAQNKLEVSKENNIDIFIDDSIEHCRNVKNGGITAFLYTSTCNQGIEVPELTRVNSWIQIYNKYKKIRQNSCKIPTKLIY